MLSLCIRDGINSNFSFVLVAEKLNRLTKLIWNEYNHQNTQPKDGIFITKINIPGTHVIRRSKGCKNVACIGMKPWGARTEIKIFSTYAANWEATQWKYVQKEREIYWESHTYQRDEVNLSWLLTNFSRPSRWPRKPLNI